MNIVLLRGTLSSDPVIRILPSEQRICSLELTTRAPDGPVSSAPVAWADPPDTVDLVKGDEIVVTGHIHRRFFRTAAGMQSRTEVVADQVIRGSDKRRVGLAIKKIAGALNDGG
jgi:single-strand DNA-binding protein